MKAFERRAEIFRILISRGHETMGRLARDLGVTDRTIRSDIAVLRADHPLATKRGNGGCVRVVERQPSQTSDVNREQPTARQPDPVVRSSNILVCVFGQPNAAVQPDSIHNDASDQFNAAVQPDNIRVGAFNQPSTSAQSNNNHADTFGQTGATVQSDNSRADVFGQSEPLRRFNAEYQGELAFLNRPTQGFAQTARALIVQIHCGRKEFCERTLLSERMYYRLMNDQVPYPTRGTVMLICVGLALGGILSEQLLDLAGFHLSAMLIGYKKALYDLCGLSVYECDEIFIALGLPSILPKPYRQCA